LEIREARLGKDHPETAQTLNNLANIYKDMGRYGKAEPLFHRSLAIKEAKLGKDHPDTARALGNLAILHHEMGQHAKAEPLLRRALAIFEAEVGKDHPVTAQALSNLAALYGDMGQPARAEPLYRRALEIREARLGKDHPETARTLNNLANLYFDTGEYAKAEPLYLRALAVYAAKLGKDHPHTAATLNNLANVSATTERWDTAAQYRDRNRQAVRAYVSGTLPILSDREQEQFLRTQDERFLHAALSHGLLRRGHPAEAALSAAWVLNGKAVAAQARAEQALLARDTRDPQAGQTARELAEARRALAALALQPPKEGQAAARARQLADLSAREQDLSRKLTRLTGRPAKAGWAEVSDVRKALPPAAVLVEIARFDGMSRSSTWARPGRSTPR
jgi:tetratricopeptide (TPR) repeat protein